MNILGALFSGGGAVNKGLDIIDQLVTDKDKAIEYKAAFYLAELNSKTIPIFDAFHKVGRQLLAFAQVAFYAWALKSNIEITPELVAGVSGATSIYTLVKGRGR